MTPTLEERVARLERYFYGLMTELCVMAGQIRSDVKKDEREDAEKQVREAEKDQSRVTHKQGVYIEPAKEGRTDWGS